MTGCVRCFGVDVFLDPEFLQSAIEQIASVDGIERDVISRHKTINLLLGWYNIYLGPLSPLSRLRAPRDKHAWRNRRLGIDNRMRILGYLINGSMTVCPTTCSIARDAAALRRRGHGRHPLEPARARQADPRLGLQKHSLFAVEQFDHILHADEPGPAVALGHRQRLSELPGMHRRRADITGLAGLHDIVQRFERLLDRRVVRADDREAAEAVFSKLLSKWLERRSVTRDNSPRKNRVASPRIAQGEK
jgi:hypothetical protein